jgi:carbonic anhydrase/acetyltransferase-like protein (isoleucine patch superfamily)
MQSLHGCVVKDNMIDMGVVMDNCVIESNSIVAAGAVGNSKYNGWVGINLGWCSARKVKDIDQSDFAGDRAHFK